ncbi:hypothetical protein AB0K23_01410 [Streptomyces sp. NPDC049602]|uniref:hypothetical protein n=1 Tax=Streptomyces sp. NPDC049602 TaxID=3155504 RepID=UPI003446EBF0
MPKFVIVTVEGTAYHEGETADMTPTLTDVGATGTLDCFVHDGDFLELRYSDGSRISIPESRIAHIADRARP